MECMNRIVVIGFNKYMHLNVARSTKFKVEIQLKKKNELKEGIVFHYLCA